MLLASGDLRRLLGVVGVRGVPDWKGTMTAARGVGAPTAARAGGVACCCEASVMAPQAGRTRRCGASGRRWPAAGPPAGS